MILQLRLDVSWVGGVSVCLSGCPYTRQDNNNTTVSTSTIAVIIIIILLAASPPHSHSQASHYIIQSPAAGIASPWKLPSTVKSAQHSLNTPSVGAFRSEPSHTPARRRRCYCYSFTSTTTTHYFYLNGHLDIYEDITAASVLRPPPPPPPPPPLPPPSPTLAQPARLHSSSSSRCTTETSASLLRQIPAVLPFFTLDGPRHLLSRYAAARHSSLPLPTHCLLHHTLTLSCRVARMSRTARPSRLLALR